MAETPKVTDSTFEEQITLNVVPKGSHEKRLQEGKARES